MSQNKETVKYKCPICKEEIYWSSKEFAEKGEPICPYDGNDMIKISNSKSRK